MADLLKKLEKLTRGSEVVSERFDFPESENDPRDLYNNTVRELDTVFVDRSSSSDNFTYIHNDVDLVRGRIIPVRVELSYLQGISLFFKSWDRNCPLVQDLREYFVAKGYVPKKEA